MTFKGLFRSIWKLTDFTARKIHSIRDFKVKLFYTFFFINMTGFQNIKKKIIFKIQSETSLSDYSSRAQCSFLFLLLLYGVSIKNSSKVCFSFYIFPFAISLAGKGVKQRQLSLPPFSSDFLSLQCLLSLFFIFVQ